MGSAYKLVEVAGIQFLVLSPGMRATSYIIIFQSWDLGRTPWGLRTRPPTEQAANGMI